MIDIRKWEKEYKLARNTYVSERLLSHTRRISILKDTVKKLLESGNKEDYNTAVYYIKSISDREYALSGNEKSLLSTAKGAMKVTDKLLGKANSLKSKKKAELVKSEEYRRLGCKDKKYFTPSGGNASWYRNCLIYVSPKTYQAASDCISVLKENDLVSSKLSPFYLLKSNGKWYLYEGNVCFGDVGKKDKEFYSFISSQTYDVGCEIEVIVLPNNKMIADAPVCYISKGEFRRVLFGVFGVSSNW